MKVGSIVLLSTARPALPQLLCGPVRPCLESRDSFTWARRDVVNETHPRGLPDFLSLPPLQPPPGSLRPRIAPPNRFFTGQRPVGVGCPDVRAEEHASHRFRRSSIGGEPGLDADSHSHLRRRYRVRGRCESALAAAGEQRASLGLVVPRPLQRGGERVASLRPPR